MSVTLHPHLPRTSTDHVLSQTSLFPAWYTSMPCYFSRRKQLKKGGKGSRKGMNTLSLYQPSADRKGFMWFSGREVEPSSVVTRSRVHLCFNSPLAASHIQPLFPSAGISCSLSLSVGTQGLSPSYRIGSLFLSPSSVSCSLSHCAFFCFPVPFSLNLQVLSSGSL